MTEGWVYFASNKEQTRVKVGFTKKVEARMSGLRTEVGHPVTLLACMPGTPATEAWIQKRFAGHLIEGEWFSLNDKIRQFIDLIGICRTTIHMNSSGVGRPRTVRHIADYPQCPCMNCRALRTLKREATQ